MKEEIHKYTISQAEFKGRVLQSLEDIKEDVGDLKNGISYSNKEITAVKVSLATKACKEDIQVMQTQINGVKLVSSVMGAVGGIIAGIAAIFVRGK